MLPSPHPLAASLPVAVPGPRSRRSGSARPSTRCSPRSVARSTTSPPTSMSATTPADLLPWLSWWVGIPAGGDLDRGAPARAAAHREPPARLAGHPSRDRAGRRVGLRPHDRGGGDRRCDVVPGRHRLLAGGRPTGRRRARPGPCGPPAGPGPGRRRRGERQTRPRRAPGRGPPGGLTDPAPASRAASAACSRLVAPAAHGSPIRVWTRTSRSHAESRRGANETVRRAAASACSTDPRRSAIRAAACAASPASRRSRSRSSTTHSAGPTSGRRSPR